MSEPRYTKAEMRAHAKEIEVLRKEAVRSWKQDRVGNCSIVIMTFKEYLALTAKRRRACSGSL